MDQNLYPLRAALAVAGSSPGRFHNHVGSGAVDCALALIGDADAHLTPPRRGAGAGTGGGRLISAAATVAAAIAFQIMPRGVSAADAFKIAGTFTFLGEMGDGLRAFVPGGTAAPRPAGGLFPADLGDTFLAVLPAALDAPQGPAFAFVPGRDLTAPAIIAWAGERDLDAGAVLLLNLSALVAEVLDGLRAIDPGTH